MSASNGGMVRNEDILAVKRTLFSNIGFSYDADEGIIDFPQFFQTNIALLPFFDSWGPAYKIIKYDLNGNLQKLNKIYESDKVKYGSLNAMLESDAEKNTRAAAEPLLWLKRGLHFIRQFLDMMCQDLKNGVEGENVAPIAENCYETHLKRYHGIIVQKFVALGMKLVPWRSSIIKELCYGKPENKDIMIEDIDKFLVNMKLVLQRLDHIYDTLKLNSDAKSSKLPRS